MTSFSYLDHLECSRCAAVLEAHALQGLCSCGSPLLARYDLERLGAAVSVDLLASREPGLWRYHELLPVTSASAIVSLGECTTPLLPLPRLGRKLGLARLSMKDEGLLPTGTFKARGATVGVSRARELGVTRFAMPTNGNAGAAWAAYGARAGLEALIVMPADAPPVPRAECVAAGARLYLVDGLIGDAGALVARAVSEQGYSDTSTLKEPYRIEGKKTIALELFEQLGWRVPGVILCPTGGGVGLIGIFKALRECQQLGWLGPELPRLVAVQASGCAPVVRAWEQGAEETEAWQDARTMAFGITVPKPLGDRLILESLQATAGCAVAVEDEQILEAQAWLAQLEGSFVCPEGAACLAAALRLRESGWLSEDDEVVALNTGSGILYSDMIEVQVPTLGREDSIPTG
ncbi:MAG: threonine synthase [Candidatus Dormibacteria bacterium]